MNHLQQLAKRINNSRYFILYLKENENTLAPLINQSCTANGCAYGSILHMVTCSGIEAFDYVFNEFYDSLNPNANYISSVWGIMFNNAMWACYNFGKVSQCHNLASHPRYDISQLLSEIIMLQFIPSTRQALLEQIMALAKPNKGGLVSQAHMNPIICEYIEDPVSMQQKMKHKHFPGLHNACHVFLYTRLLNERWFSI